MQLEEGEIQDDEPFSVYSPLERPNEGSNQQKSAQLTYSSESSSESEDYPKLPKRPKTCLPNKYNVWVMNENQEDLALSMNLCGVDGSKDRAVEYYPYKLASTSGLCPFSTNKFRYGDENCCVRSCEEDSTDRSSTYPTSGKRKMIYKKRKQCMLSPRDIEINEDAGYVLEGLSVNESDPIERVADDIADKLNETNREIVVRCVSVLGRKKAMEFFEKTLEIEKEGGLLVNNRSRRRTPGGVYLYLIRRDRSLSPQHMREIFNDLQERKTKLTLKKSHRRKKPNRKGCSRQGEVLEEKEELENPPPSPATDGDATPLVKSNSVLIQDLMESL